MAVVITKPQAGAVLKGTVTVEATFSGKNFNVATCSIGDKQLAQDNALPISFSIDTTRVGDEDHRLTVAVRYRTAGGALRWQKAHISVKVANAVPSEWDQVAVEDQSFTLTGAREVRYGKGTAWTSKIMGAGTYRCDNATFGDPAYGIVKVCEARPTTQEPPPPPPPPPPSSGFRYAVQGRPMNDINLCVSLGIKIMRTGDQSPATSVDAMRAYLLNYQSNGVDPLLLINTGQMNQNMDQFPGNLPEFARQLGPGGPMAHATRPLRLMEIGNEQFWGYGEKPGVGYAPQYAAKFRDTSVAVRAANSEVKCLAMLDGNGDYGTLVNGLYSVPNFHQYVDGWVFHSYGTMNGWHVPKIQTCLDLVAQKGAPDTIPVYITEDGWSSDNGQRLEPDNYGWPQNMTYADVGREMRQKIADLRALPWGPRLRVWCQYITTDGAWPGASNGRESYFGVLKIDGSAKGDMTQAARDLAGQYP